MFTGIVEAIGNVQKVIETNEGIQVWVETPFLAELKPDQSIAHNGVCLTVTEISSNSYSVLAVPETLVKTNLKALKPGDSINLERAMSLSSRLDGHLVQGHVDQTGICKKKTIKEGNCIFTFQFDPLKGNYVVEKGSVCLNGISLTVFDIKEDAFSVAVIPYTYTHTNICDLEEGDEVNLEFDIIGKYLKHLFLKYSQIH